MILLQCVIASLLSQGQPKDALPSSPAVPEIIEPSRVPAIITSLPSYATFEFSNVAFWHGKLYAATNVGLLEFRELELTALHRWNARDAVIERVWRDEAQDSLWCVDASMHALRRLDASGWHLVPAPVPAKGYFTRGEVLSGIQSASDASGFWIVSAGAVWRWDGRTNQWDLQPCAGAKAPITGFAPLHEGLLFFERVEPMRLLDAVPRSDKCDVVHGAKRESPTNSRIIRRDTGLQPFFADEVVSVADRACVRTGEGKLLWASMDRVIESRSPGPCDAMTRTSSGTILASFRGAGLSVLEGKDWKRRFENPSPPDEGEHRACVTEEDGRVAYATSSVPRIDKSVAFDPKNPKWVRIGTDGLWISQGDRLVPLYRDGAWSAGVIEKK